MIFSKFFYQIFWDQFFNHISILILKIYYNMLINFLNHYLLRYDQFSPKYLTKISILQKFKVINNEDPLIISEQFPIVTICDFYTHQNLRQLHMNSAQCLLPINVLIEKFYVFIWFWLYVLAVVTFLNIISWIYEICSSTSIGFIRKYLRIKEKMSHSCNSKRQAIEIKFYL